MKRKIFMILLASALAFSVTGCGGGGSDGTESTSTSVSTSASTAQNEAGSASNGEGSAPVSEDQATVSDETAADVQTQENGVATLPGSSDDKPVVTGNTNSSNSKNSNSTSKSNSNSTSAENKTNQNNNFTNTNTNSKNNSTTTNKNNSTNGSTTTSGTANSGSNNSNSNKENSNSSTNTNNGNTAAGSSTSSSSTSSKPKPTHTHSYTSSVTKQPTCSSAGVRTYTCSCGNSYTESIPATGNHNWIELTNTVHHDEVGHYATKVVKEAWDEPIKEWKQVCSVCNKEFDTVQQVGDHIIFEHDGEAFYSEKQIVTGTKHHDAETAEYWVVDKAAYNETVVIGYECSVCGATK